MHFLDTIYGVHKSQVLKAGGDAICPVVLILKHMFQENSRSTIAKCVVETLECVHLSGYLDCGRLKCVYNPAFPLG